MQAQIRRAFDLDTSDLCLLADKIRRSTGNSQIKTDLMASLPGFSADYPDVERRLETAAWSLRRRWLELAHKPADRTPKSPCSGQSSHLAGGGDVDFGYERDLDVSVLENRSSSYMQHPPGWSTEFVLTRSGQAALATLLQMAVSKWGASGPLSVVHSGAYFETTTLLQNWPSRVLQRFTPEQSVTGDLVIIEPVWCDGKFGLGINSCAARRALLVDTTLVGPAFDLTPYLGACDLVIAYSSGLKLDQAGLELANVGIIRIFSRADNASDISSTLRTIRGLTAAGLTFDELSALSAPWFMDRSYADNYNAAIFEHNRMLAEAVGTQSLVFSDKCHPSLITPGASAPFCAIEIRHNPSLEDYRRLANIAARQIEARGLVVTRGGSFGFRGHRFELIEPEHGTPFLRVALGWRDGYSRKGVCDLFAELASKPSMQALD